MKGSVKQSAKRRWAIENTPLKIFVTLLILALTPAANAGIVDSPVPQLGGVTAINLFQVTGVVNIGGLGTYFSCTSAEKTNNIHVGVELFDQGGGGPLNNAAGTSLTLVPGQTATFGTAGANGWISDSLLGGTFARGSARILSTSAKLICTAVVADTVGGPPASLTNLNVITKLKQK